MQVASTTQVNHSFLFTVSHAKRSYIETKAGLEPSGVILGNSAVFPNVLILTNPRQLAAYRIRGD